jgi:hypothetical protein
MQMTDEKRGRGRPPYAPTDKDRNMVETMIGFGIPDYDIAAVLQIDLKTLRKYYAEELRVGHVKMNAKVASSLYKQATGDGPMAVKAAMFWLERRAGWRAPPREFVEVPGKKEQRVLDAAEAPAGTPWAQLLQ